MQKRIDDSWDHRLVKSRGCLLSYESEGGGNLIELEAMMRVIWLKLQHTPSQIEKYTM